MNNQETWLISLSIGPVQDFISAALRTRDLWFGSHMLSEVSKAAAREINKHEAAELIFPAVDKNSKELEENSPLNVANRIVVEMSGNENTVKEIIGAGKGAAKQKLSYLIEQAKSKLPIPIRKKIWNIQAKPDDLLELYGTAVRIKDENYPKAWKHLSRLNSARKNSRDFKPQLNDPEEDVLYGLPKSSLDGRRETVLPENLSKQVRRRLRMGDGEQLDVMGLVKRLAGGELNELNPSAKLQFTPTTRIAIDPWLRKTIKEDKEKAKARLANICEKLEKFVGLDSGLVTRVKGNQKNGCNEGIYDALPFDAALLYQGVLDEAIRKSREEKRFKEKEILKELRKDIMEGAWNPCPYYALLLADGDHMGRLIKAAQDKDHHKKISNCLSEFARSVPETARKEEYRAHCIYAGGDDVLLMAPLDTVLPLANKLRTDFTEKLQKVADDLDEKAPTFSVGIVVAHMQTPIGRVRRLVKQAESLAKGSDTESPRNALAIIVDPRSGAEMPFRAKWKRDPNQKQDDGDDDQNEQKSPVEELNELAQLYRTEQLPTGFGYELRQIDQLVHDMKEKEKAGEIAKLEMQRILNRKNQGGGDKEISQGTKDTVLDHAKNKDSFSEVCQEHLIARWLGAHGEERG